MLNTGPKDGPIVGTCRVRCERGTSYRKVRSDEKRLGIGIVNYPAQKV